MFDISFSGDETFNVEMEDSEENLSPSFREINIVPYPGEDGYSPIVEVSAISGGHSVNITDKEGEHSFNVMDGLPGRDGTDGSPGRDGTAATISVGNVTKLSPNSTPTVTNSGSSSSAVFDFGIPQGEKGDTGAEGYSPTISVTDIEGGHTVTITTKNGSVSFNVMDGATGATGQGVPANGTTGQALVKASDDDYDTEFKTLTASDVGALAVGDSAKFANAIHYGAVDSTSTSTVFTATIPGITEYYDGLTVMLYNGVVTSAANYTININNLGAYGTYNNMTMGNPVTPTNPTRDTTIFNINYAMLMTYCSHIGGGSTAGWICYRGYDANTNTIGYQIRSNSFSLPMTSIVYRYRLLFQSADNAHFVPATNSTSTNATAARTVCQDPINPFGAIVYYGTTSSVAANSRPSVANLWQEYTFNLGYSFQKSTNYSLTSWKPVYVKCAPQGGISAVIDSDTPIVQDLPTSEDGKIYILLGFAYSTTNIELVYYHPVYYYKDGAVKPWTGG